MAVRHSQFPRAPAHPAVMNLSHVVHEFSFGPFFPAISQPLDMTMQLTQDRTLKVTRAIKLTRSLRRLPVLLACRAYDLHRRKQKKACDIPGAHQTFPRLDKN